MNNPMMAEGQFWYKPRFAYYLVKEKLISRFEADVYACLITHCGKDNKGWAGQRKIAAEVAADQGDVSRAYNRLKAAGLITELEPATHKDPPVYEVTPIPETFREGYEIWAQTITDMGTDHIRYGNRPSQVWDKPISDMGTDHIRDGESPSEKNNENNNEENQSKRNEKNRREENLSDSSSGQRRSKTPLAELKNRLREDEGIPAYTSSEPMRLIKRDYPEPEVIPPKPKPSPRDLLQEYLKSKELEDTTISTSTSY